MRNLASLCKYAFQVSDCLRFLIQWQCAHTCIYWCRPNIMIKVEPQSNIFKARRRYTYRVYMLYRVLHGTKMFNYACMIIMFASNWIFPRARAHMRARKCALRTNAHNARTRVRLYPNINKICILLVYERFGRIPVQYGKSTSI